jgi:hypothetical protein
VAAVGRAEAGGAEEEEEGGGVGGREEAALQLQRALRLEESALAAGITEDEWEQRALRLEESALAEAAPSRSERL